MEQVYLVSLAKGIIHAHQILSHIVYSSKSHRAADVWHRVCWCLLVVLATVATRGIKDCDRKPYTFSSKIINDHDYEAAHTWPLPQWTHELPMSYWHLQCRWKNMLSMPFCNMDTFDWTDALYKLVHIFVLYVICQSAITYTVWCDGNQRQIMGSWWPRTWWSRHLR